MGTHDGTQVYADGSGLWHALVPADHPHAERVARRLIRFEIAARGEAGRNYRLQIEEVDRTATHIHYRER